MITLYVVSILHVLMLYSLPFTSGHRFNAPIVNADQCFMLL